MSEESIDGRSKPAPAHGVLHAFAAATYSLAGLRRLLCEAAFRQELMLAVIFFGLFAAIGAPLESFCIQAMLFLVLVSVEALNTAIEVLVDRISPSYAEFAGQAKDLGSFAVFCLLGVNALFASLVVWRAVF